MTQTDPKQCVNSTRPSYACKTENQEMDDLDLLKIGIILGLFLGVLITCGVCYFILCCIAKFCKKNRHGNRKKKFFTYMNLFSGGVFFATSFLHLLPEARDEMQKFSKLASILLDFPSCEFMISVGFFLVLFAEQLTSKLHKIYEGRKKAKLPQPLPKQILTSAVTFNVTSENEIVENQNIKTIPEVKSVENCFESEKWDNKSTSLIICNDDTCTDCNVSSTENLSPDEELPRKQDCRDNDFVDSSLCTTNTNEIPSSNNDGASMEPHSIVTNPNSSTLLHYSHESSTHDVQSENSCNPEFSAPRLPYCNCSLNQLHRYMNPDRNAINKTKPIPESYIQKAIESSDALRTTQPMTREGYRAMILLISLLFHSLFDGLALGLQSDRSTILTILLAIFLHKCLVAFSLTLKLFRAFRGRVRLIVVSLFIFSIISPIGCLIGWLVSGSDSIHIVIRTGCSGILQSVATGTFLYVTFIEILGPELGHGQTKFISIFFILFGYLLIAILKILM